MGGVEGRQAKTVQLNDTSGNPLRKASVLPCQGSTLGDDFAHLDVGIGLILKGKGR